MTENSPVITLRQSLVMLASLYCAARKLSRSRVSTVVFGSGHVLNRLAAGQSDVTTATFEKAVKWFDTNWPDDLPWPAGLARPSLARDAAALGEEAAA